MWTGLILRVERPVQVPLSSLRQFPVRSVLSQRIDELRVSEHMQTLADVSWRDTLEDFAGDESRRRQSFFFEKLHYTLVFAFHPVCRLPVCDSESPRVARFFGSVRAVQWLSRGFSNLVRLVLVGIHLAVKVTLTALCDDVDAVTNTAE